MTILPNFGADRDQVLRNNCKINTFEGDTMDPKFHKAAAYNNHYDPEANQETEVEEQDAISMKLGEYKEANCL